MLLVGAGASRDEHSLLKNKKMLKFVKLQICSTENALKRGQSTSFEVAREPKPSARLSSLLYPPQFNLSAIKSKFL